MLLAIDKTDYLVCSTVYFSQDYPTDAWVICFLVVRVSDER